MTTMILLCIVICTVGAIPYGRGGSFGNFGSGNNGAGILGNGRPSEGFNGSPGIDIIAGVPSGSLRGSSGSPGLGLVAGVPLGSFGGSSGSPGIGPIAGVPSGSFRGNLDGGFSGSGPTVVDANRLSAALGGSLAAGAGGLAASLGGSLGTLLRDSGLSGSAGSSGPSGERYITISYEAYVRIMYYISALQNTLATAAPGVGLEGGQFGGSFADGISGRGSNIAGAPAMVPIQPRGFMGGPGFSGSPSGDISSTLGSGLGRSFGVGVTGVFGRDANGLGTGRFTGSFSRGVSGNIGGTGGFPGVVGTMPGAIGTMPGAIGTMPGAIGTMPGAIGTMQGAIGTMPGAIGTMPGAIATMQGMQGGRRGMSKGTY